MHTMTRRAALSGLAALPAVSLSARLEAAPAERLADLIADFRRITAESDRLDEELHDLMARTDLPQHSIRHGRRRILNDDGSVTLTRWEFRSPADIHRHFEHSKCDHFPDHIVANALRQEKQALARLARQIARWEAARAASGITALEELSEAMIGKRWAALDLILAYRPATFDEYEEKHCFLGEMHARGFEFVKEDLDLLFGVATVAA